MHGNAVVACTPNSGRCAREPWCNWPEDRAPEVRHENSTQQLWSLAAALGTGCRAGHYALPRRSAHVPGDRCSHTRLCVRLETRPAMRTPSQSSLAQHHVAAPQAMVIFPVDACPGKEHVFTSLRSKTAPWAQPASLRLGASPLWTPPSSRLSSSAWLRLAPHRTAPQQAT